MMTSCECHAQFCYTCGSVWKTCTCNVFGLEAANNILAAEIEEAVMNTGRLLTEYVRIRAVREEASMRYTDALQTLEELPEADQDHPDGTRASLHAASRRFLDTSREAHRAHVRWQAARRLRNALIALA